MKKKIFSLVSILLLLCLAGCSSQADPKNELSETSDITALSFENQMTMLSQKTPNKITIANSVTTVSLEKADDIVSFLQKQQTNRIIEKKDFPAGGVYTFTLFYDDVELFFSYHSSSIDSFLTVGRNSQINAFYEISKEEYYSAQSIAEKYISKN